MAKWENANLLPESRLSPLLDESDEWIAIIVKSIATAKTRQIEIVSRVFVRPIPRGVISSGGLVVLKGSALEGKQSGDKAPHSK